MNTDSTFHDEGEAPMTAAAATRAQAAEWLERKGSGEWTVSDQAALDAWLGQSWKNATAFWRLESAWTRADRLSALRKPGFGRKAFARSRSAAPFFKIAVSVALLAGASFGLYEMQSFSHIKTYATPVGGRELLTLADGSQIELNTDTVLRVATGTSNREVWLDKGEAFFEIRHDAAHPFVVNAGAQRIVDLGTKFTARRNGGQTEVSLLEGRAKIETVGNSARSAILSPGDVAVATADKVSVSGKSTQDLADQLGWQRGMLVFRHTPLAEAAAAFNRYNDRKIVVAGADIGRLTINGTFPTNATDLFSRAAKDAFGLHVEKQQGRTVISR
jgi:transmembrane sensor